MQDCDHVLDIEMHGLKCLNSMAQKVGGEAPASTISHDHLQHEQCDGLGRATTMTRRRRRRV